MINITSLILFVIALSAFCAIVIGANKKRKEAHFIVASAIVIIIVSWAFLLLCCEALLSPEDENSKLEKYTALTDEKYVVTTKMAKINEWYLINNGDMIFYSEDNGHKNKMTIRYMNEEDVKIIPVPKSDEDDFHVEMYHARKKFLFVYTDVTFYKVFISPDYISTDTDFVDTICDRE